MKSTAMSSCRVLIYGLLLLLGTGLHGPLHAQQVLGAITGTVKDASGGAVPDATVKAVNMETNLSVTAKTQGNGSYSLSNLPAGTYHVSFAKEGFETETHTEVLVNADRTSTVDGNMRPGAVSTTVEVTATPLMNQVDTTNGYVVDQLTIQDTPLGTGSFTQLAILSPGVHADFLGGAGSNAGLGNQAIFANGQRDTSNSFSLNGVGANNLFNGNSTSQVGENRFVLNTGESFGAGGQIQTSTSVYGAIGQALPTPPSEAIQEISVNAAMYDASQGANSGAHVSVITKSGTNTIHGQLYDRFQNSDLNAAPFFYNADPAVTTKDPFMNRNQFGATFGGPIKKNKLFYFVSYQGIRVADATDATKDAVVPLGLTDDRSAQGIVNAIQSSYGQTISTGQVNPVALSILQAKLPNGQYMIPSAQITNPNTAVALGFDAVVQGPNAQSRVNQGIASIDYVVNDKDQLTGKYFIQDLSLIHISNYRTYIHSDNVAIGRLAGQFIVDHLKKKYGEPKGNVVAIRGLLGVEGEINRDRGAKEIFDKYPGIHIVADPVADWIQAKAKDRMTEVLRAQPHIDAVYGHNDPMAVGAYLAAKELGREQEMIFVGVDGLGGPAGGIQKVIDGVLAATFVYPLCVDKAVEIGRRMLHEPGFQPDKEYVIDSAMVTKENAAEMYRRFTIP